MHGVTLGHMDAAMFAWQHGLGRVWVWVSGVLRHAVEPLLANPPHARPYHQQKHQVLHAMRPKITSSTKREPTYPSSSKPEPA